MVKEQKSVFEKFTGKYALSKTLRFELKPDPITREWMNKHFEYDTKLQTFLKDQSIEDAYQTLKPVFDKLHEEFITSSLENSAAKKIVFADYFDLYRKQKKEQDKDERRKLDKPIETEEKKLRGLFAELYKTAGESFKAKAGSDEKGKEVLKENGYKILTESGILKYVKSKIDDFVGLGLKTREGKEIIKADLEEALGTADSKGVFSGFFTYLVGFNQNRENYYSLEDKSTSVANRIINENLPKFVDNVIDFEKRKEEYLGIYQFLKKADILLKGKNQKGEEQDLVSITIDIFAIDYFVNCFSQKEIEDYNLKIGNANFIINLYNQQKDKSEGIKKLPKFKTLYKQIGCGEKGEFIPNIKDDKELKEIFEKVKNNSKEYLKNVNDFIDYVLNHQTYENIFWSDKAINTISNKYFANWSILKEKLKTAKIFKKDGEEIKVPQAVMLKELFSVLDDGTDDKLVFKESFNENNDEKQKIILNIDKKQSTKLLEIIFVDIKKNQEVFNNLTQEVLALTDYKKDENTQVVKQWLDSLLNINQIMKYWKVKEKFSTESDLSEKLKNILLGEDNPTHVYDIVRNYVTKKPTSELNKLKLNFENSSLADGWDVNKEKDNSCIILQDENGLQYLAIMKYGYTGLFRQDIKNNPLFVPDNFAWKKMNYKLLPGPNKMLPKVLFSGSWTENNPTPAKIERIYEDGTFKKGTDFNKNDLHELIDFYKNELKKYPTVEENWNKIFGFKFSDTRVFESIDQFYTEVEKQGYKLEFISINKTKLDEFVNDGKIYLFKICNKDFNLKDGSIKTGNKNLHTIYWSAVFSNTENKPKLNGGAEIFFRPRVANLEKKKDKSGREVTDHKRFEEEKFVFHCPVTLNFGLKSSKLNDEINDTLSNNDKVCFLGIDRGEKHLAYYSLIDGKGEIISQGSFNEINGQNYAEKLEEKAGGRDDARKNWKTIGTIKELKDGYISQVVRRIVDLAIANNAYVVLENLNVGFKRGRQKIEKQVYQKLELALAKKLNFLVDKNAKDDELGSVSKALQLTPLVNNFGDIEKVTQFGLMLYTRANYTSQTDPKTGWRKTIYFSKTKQEDLKAEICEKFDDIVFDGKDYRFDYTDNVTGKKWNLYSGKDGKSLDRFRGGRNAQGQWLIEKQDIVKLLDKVFENFNKNKSLKEQILGGDGLDNSLVSKLKFAIDLIQQIRNTGIKTEGEDEDNFRDGDFILSSVRDENGKHFDSREYWDMEQKEKKVVMPSSGDANGAYNIARKGFVMNEHNKRGLSPFIRDEEWDAWLAGDGIWKKWLKENEKTLKFKTKPQN